MSLRRALLTLALAGAAAALGPAAAGAHSIVRVTGGELSYQSLDATSLNSLRIQLSGNEIQIRDPTVDGGMDPGLCRPGEVTNDANAWIVEVFCPRSSINRARIDVGEREDAASVALPLPITVLGGPGATPCRAAMAPTASAAATATTRWAAGRAVTRSTADRAPTRSTAGPATTSSARATASPTGSAAATVPTR